MSIETQRIIYEAWERRLRAGDDDEDKDGESHVSSEDSDFHEESSVESDLDYDFKRTPASKNIPPAPNATANTKTRDVNHICAN